MNNKKVSDSKSRILEILNYYKISQTELCKRTGLQKSALSNYLNGDRIPRQDQISLIAEPFNINPSWLMGYNVPMFMSPAADHPRQLQEDEAELLDKYDMLNEEGKKYLYKQADYAIHQAEYLIDIDLAKGKTG